MLDLVIELTGLVLCGFGILMVCLSPKTTCHAEYAFLKYYICLFLFMGAKMAARLLNGRPGAAVRAGLYVSNFLEILTAFLLLCIVSEHLVLSAGTKKIKETMRKTMFSLLLAHIALLGFAQFTGLYYVVDEFNVCRRGAGYLLSYACAAVIFLTDIVLLMRYGHRMTLKGFTVCCFYIVVTVVCILLRLLIREGAFLAYAAIIVGVAMLIVITQNQTARYYLQEAENERLKVDIMLNQIQPHFLYNTLTAIQELCHSDPAQAEAAIVKFSRYLRGNMDSLRTERAIPFEEELKHTRIYLELEQMRFEDKLQVRYDILCTDFALPPLSLQPIVENAVRHGVRGNADGAGVVTIATRERPDRYEVSVTDNGPGFRSAGLPEDNQHSHVGIKNVRERLSRVCGGTLDIASGVGRGATVTITIPKTEESAERGKENGNVDFRLGRRAESVEYPVPGHCRG